MSEIFGRWSSNFGPLTIEGSPQNITGSWDQGQGRIGRIRAGTFDPATSKLLISYHQDWTNLDGTAQFTLSADGNQLEGTYEQVDCWGSWNMTRG